MLHNSMYLKLWKRLFDLITAFLLLIIFLAPLAIIALLILITSGRPILFSQERVGREGKIFKIRKFRTMVRQEEEDSSVTVAGDRRVTPIGIYLRKWKLDEIPQLWNVLLGEMSLVGPRPDVRGYADKLEGEARKLLQLRPGITGPATLAYRNEEEILAKVEDPIQYNNEVIYPNKVVINLKYLDNCSFLLDLSYIFQTIFG